MGAPTRRPPHLNVDSIQQPSGSVKEHVDLTAVAEQRGAVRLLLQREHLYFRGQVPGIEKSCLTQVDHGLRAPSVGERHRPVHQSTGDGIPLSRAMGKIEGLVVAAQRGHGIARVQPEPGRERIERGPDLRQPLTRRTVRGVHQMHDDLALRGDRAEDRLRAEHHIGVQVPVQLVRKIRSKRRVDNAGTARPDRSRHDGRPGEDVEPAAAETIHTVDDPTSDIEGRAAGKAEAIPAPCRAWPYATCGAPSSGRRGILVSALRTAGATGTSVLADPD